MSTLTGMLFDVSSSMKVKTTGRVDASGEEWVRSIFNIIDHLIKHDVSSDNHMFAVGVGERRGKIFDIIETVNNFLSKPVIDKDSYNQIIESIYKILEKNGAYSIRAWATKEVIRSAVSKEMASRLLFKLETDNLFLRQFVNECLPQACRDVGSSSLLKNIQYMVSYAVGQRASKNEFEALVNKAFLKSIDSSCIVSVHEASKVIYGNADERELTPERTKELISTVEQFIYGSGILFTAIGLAIDLFKIKKFKHHKKLLFVFSDGLPADDGDISDMISNLKDVEVTVISFFVTSSRRVEARKLFSCPETGWRDDSRFLFNLSSTVPTQIPQRAIFMKRGWKIDISNSETKLFLHVRNYDNIGEACVMARNAVCFQDALTDVLVSDSLDIYINQTTTGLNTYEQEGRCCFENAFAAVVHFAFKRIQGRDGGYPEMTTLRQEFIDRYEMHGAETLNVLKEVCLKYRLQIKEVGLVEAMKAITTKRPVVAIFQLTDSEWNAFKDFFRDHPTGILTCRQLKIKRPTNDQLSGHAVVFTSFNGECLCLMNSWGNTWADMGFCRVENPSILDLKFIDVYWKVGDLTCDENKYYKTHDTKISATLNRTIMTLPTAKYRCPLCARTSNVTAFTGTLSQAICPLCSGSFYCCEAGNILSLNMYLSYMSH